MVSRCLLASCLQAHSLDMLQYECQHRHISHCVAYPDAMEDIDQAVEEDWPLCAFQWRRNSRRFRHCPLCPSNNSPSF